MKRRILLALIVLLVVAVLPVSLFAGGTKEEGKKVVLYSAHTQEIIDALVPKFKADTGIEAEVVKMGSGDVISRVKAEKDNPQCDVIWSIGGEQLEANSNLLAPYTPKDWDKIEDVFKAVRNNVYKMSNEMQVPWENSSIFGDFYFKK